LDVFSTPSHVRPSFATGWARNAAESIEPDLWRGLVGAWVAPLGVTGARLMDVSGQRNHGTLANMDASNWRTSSRRIQGYSLNLDGSSERIECGPSPKAAGIIQTTVLAWVRAPTLDDADAIAMLGDYTDDPRNWAWLFRSVGTSGGIQVFITAAPSDAGAASGQAGGVYPADIWTQIGFRFDGTGADNNARLKLIRDGRIFDFPSFSGTIPSAIAAATDPLTIGGALGVAGYWNGDIASLKIYNRNLTRYEISAHFDNPIRMFRKRRIAFFSEPDPGGSVLPRGLSQLETGEVASRGMHEVESGFVA